MHAEQYIPAEWLQEIRAQSDTRYPLAEASLIYDYHPSC